MDVPILSGYSLADLLRGVHPEWLKVFDTRLLTIALQKVAEKVGNRGTSPAPEFIFEAFRYGGPKDQDVIIFGQDPYPNKGDAQGICFSAPRTMKTPASLKKIFGCLRRAKLMGETSCNDLRSWVAQNVLMVNTALTTEAGVCGGHLALWKPFMTDLFGKYCRLRAAIGPAHFLLWGGKADVFASVARRSNHVVHAWSHPSPMGDNPQPAEKRFVNCPHFEEVNQARVSARLPPIVWDPMAPAIGFTDGSCLDNGRPASRASFATLVMGAAFGKTTISGLVEPREYKFIDDTLPHLGICTVPGSTVAPTNNRGEWLGIIYCFLAVLRARVTGEFELCSDSYNSLMTLKEWYANRVKKGSETELKNQDLLQIVLALHAALKTQTSKIFLTHYYSHQKEPPPTAPARERFLWTGNKKADLIAEKSLKDFKEYAVRVESPLVSVRQLALRE